MLCTIKYRTRNGERGSLLVAVLAVLILFGATYMASNSLLDGGDMTPDDARIQTKVEMETIADAISAYVQVYNRLPCPADPATGRNLMTFGREAGDADGCLVGTGASQGPGILPFRTLGLADRFAQDAWGNFYTYNVSRVFAETNLAATTDIYIHCRLEDRWVFDNTVNPVANSNARKARFCCPASTTNADISPGNDIQIFNGGTQIDPNLTVAGNRPTTNAADVDIAAPTLAVAETVETFAYVLVSHGDNGNGAFLVDGSLGRKALLNIAPAAEDENANNDRIYRAQTLNYSTLGYGTTAGSPYYDDIVLYRTQFGTYAELGGGNCVFPY